MEKSKIWEKISKLSGWCQQHKAERLYDLIIEHKPKTIVEIGVYGGRSLVAMAEAAQITNSTVIGVDPYSELEIVQHNLDGSKINFTPPDLKMIMKEANEAISPYRDVTILEMTSGQAFECFPYHEINFLHLDGNHSSYAVLADLNMWSRKLAPNAIIIMDDINWETVNDAIKRYGKLSQIEDHITWGVYKHK